MDATVRKQFAKICRKSQEQLKASLEQSLKAKYDTVIVDDGFIYAHGDIPILLVAHLDTVHTHEPTEIICKENSMSSPQGIGGDDRCGVYMIKQIIKRHKCSVLFCEDEEVGGVGASKFIKHPVSADLQFNYIMEFDRRGYNDAVFYDCDNADFTDFICRYGWKEEIGSFSDIDIIAPYLGVAAVNLSSGYYNAHQLTEYVMLDEMVDNINRVCLMIEDTTENDKYEYIEAKYPASYYYYKYGNGYGTYNSGMDSYYDDGYYNYCGGFHTSGMSNSYGDGKWDITPDENYYVKFLWGIDYIDEGGRECYTEVTEVNQYAAVGRFLSLHPLMVVADIENIECFGPDEFNL